jgi:hypothetical protein
MIAIHRLDGFVKLAACGLRLEKWRNHVRQRPDLVGAGHSRGSVRLACATSAQAAQPSRALGAGSAGDTAGLLLALVAGVVGYGYYQFYRPRSTPLVALDTTTTTERIARQAPGADHLRRLPCA